ncbi:TetR/AcrR family transcriptional regulator [Methanolobus vulcani]|uniref:TetR/AcrR family transcriptional regulator n=1 Tax=Methanolobus vulcani TaxID=38026 RepID=A0A7Z8P292_9EURY|nr:TetR/AcrR family transcriptional regulator [Methanolobus vulcani]TQD25365.1 TetR/AcrR family transcriptional regulator [Methanolobus vulcani]
MKKQVEDKKAALLQASLKLFTENGFHGTSTAHISKEAGVATGTLFNYFPTKEDLINALYFDIKGKLSRSLAKDIQNQSTLHDKFWKIWYDLIEWGLNNQEDFHFVDQFCSSPYISDYTREVVMGEYSFYHDLVKDGIATGEFGDYSEGMVASIFYQSSRTIVDLILYSEPQDKNKAIEDGFAIIWKGLTEK